MNESIQELKQLVRFNIKGTRKRRISRFFEEEKQEKAEFYKSSKFIMLEKLDKIRVKAQAIKKISVSLRRHGESMPTKVEEVPHFWEVDEPMEEH